MMLKTRKGGGVFIGTEEELKAWQKVSQQFEEMMMWGKTAPVKKKRIRRKMKKHADKN